MRGANETVSNSITGTTGLLPPIPETEPVFVPRLLPSTRCLWSEGKVLARLLYKVKNQHRSTLYYRKLQQIMRVLRNMTKIELYLQTCYEQGHHDGVARRGGGEEEGAALSTGPHLVSTQVEHMSGLAQRLSTLCRAVYSLMEREYSETYFVPLMVTGMALVARLNRVARMMREEDIPVARLKLNIRT